MEFQPRVCGVRIVGCVRRGVTVALISAQVMLGACDGRGNYNPLSALLLIPARALSNAIGSDAPEPNPTPIPLPPAQDRIGGGGDPSGLPVAETAALTATEAPQTGGDHPESPSQPPSLGQSHDGSMSGPATKNTSADGNTVIQANGLQSQGFVHPGLLHTKADFERMRTKVANSEEPWMSGWARLSRHIGFSYQPRPLESVFRGSDGVHTQTYPLLYRDAAAAYANALAWQITGDERYAKVSISILDAWSLTLRSIEGTSDKFLASGIYGYQMANAAEIMRDYRGWSKDRFDRFTQMMLTVFYPMNHDFLVHHNGQKVDHYWANWDLANMASMLAIGVLADRRDIYQEAVDYFYHGTGNGSLHNLVWKLYDGGLGQIQESGRDQGHSTLDIALVGVFCQMAWSQGLDLFGYDNNRVLAGAEYVARYNLGYDVPYTTYKNSDVTQTTISADSRGTLRPIWELLYNHYVVRKGLSAPGITESAGKSRPEGGGGDYGSTSGGFDQLGFGTLVYTLE